MKKRGISPLIATILLIGFTVVLAALVLTWGQGWFSDLTETSSEAASKDLACINEGGLEIVNVCDDAGATDVTVRNTGQATITSGTINVDGEDEDTTALVNLAVGSFNTADDIATDANTSVYTSFSFTSTEVGAVTCTGPTYTVPSAGVSAC